MTTTIHVGNLNFETNEDDLKKFFSKYGKVTDSYIVRRGGRPRGYGFVEFDSSGSADNALAANGTDLDGRNITIEKAKGKIVKSNFSDEPRRSSPSRGYGGGGYGGGGYGGRSYNNGPNRYGGGYRGGDYDGGDYDGGGYGGGGYGGRSYNNGPGRYGGGYGGSDRNENYSSGGGGYGGGGYGGRSYNNGPNRYGSRQYGGGRPRRNYSFRPYNSNSRFGGRIFQRRSNVEKEKSVSTIYVSNLPFSFDDASLAKLFSDNYKVKTSHVVNSMNGRSRGYGFVEFETEEDQLRAIKEMDQKEVKGPDDSRRVIEVKVALVDKSSNTANDDKKQDE